MYRRPWQREEVVKRVKNFANYKPPKAHAWATYIPERSPMFKTAESEAKARQAVKYDSRPYILFNLVDNEWVRVEECDEWSNSRS